MTRANSTISKCFGSTHSSLWPNLNKLASRIFSKDPQQVNQLSPRSDKDQTVKSPKPEPRNDRVVNPPKSDSKIQKDPIEKSPKPETRKGQLEKSDPKVQTEKSPKSETEKDQTKKFPKSETHTSSIGKSDESGLKRKDQFEPPQAVELSHPGKMSPNETKYVGSHDNNHKATSSTCQTPQRHLIFSGPRTYDYFGKTVDMDPPRYSQYVTKRHQMKVLFPKIVQITDKRDKMDLLSTKSNFSEEAAAVVNSSIGLHTEKEVSPITHKPKMDQSSR